MRPRPDRDGRVLVVVQLDGGNDGINTVVPHADPGYARHAQACGCAANRLVRVNDQVGLHPALADAGRLLDAGQLAIVQGVSYPNPNRSHFRSMAIWHSARLDPEEHGGLGWLGGHWMGIAARRQSLLVGSGAPPSRAPGRRSAASALDRLDDFLLAPGADPRGRWARPTPQMISPRLSAATCSTPTPRPTASPRSRGCGAATARYPATGLASRLELIARLLKCGFGARVYYTLQSGYDTHAAQRETHARLLDELGGALKAFLDDLTAARLADRVVVLCFSEFGRTVVENSSGGTDHGTSGPVLLAGPAVRGRPGGQLRPA